MRGPIGRTLSFLTPRGRCVVGGAGTLLGLGLVLGERPLVQLSVFALVLPLLSSAVVSREQFRLTVRRTVEPPRLPRGGSADVVLEVTNADSRTGGLWMLVEQLPTDLGVAPAFVVDRLGRGATARLPYRVHGARRGRHVLGPLRLRLVDPFGLVERTAVGAEGATLLVVPRVRPLGPGGPVGGEGGGEGSHRSFAVHGEDDVSTREYRRGDDLRKVHWRATARMGELMVRLEERPWRSQATIFLDTRSRAHLLAGRTGRALPAPARDDCPPADSLEWQVEAAASIGTVLSQRGSALRVVTDIGLLRPASGRGAFGTDELLERLATVGPSRLASLDPGIEQLCRAAGDGPVVCLLGAVGPDDVVALIRARSGPTTDLAILADVGSWAPQAPGPGRGGASRGSRSTLDRQREDAAALLRAAGWRVATARADMSVSEVWASLGAPPTADGAGPRAVSGEPVHRAAAAPARPA